jgi:SPP1 family predicted phage head-tail adaptor
MEAGNLNRLITVQKKIINQDSDGYTNETWVDLRTYWAEMITSGGKEFFAAQRFNEETTAVFRVRFTNAITTDMRIRLGHRCFEIIPPLNDVDGQRVELLIAAKEVV